MVFIFGGNKFLQVYTINTHLHFISEQTQNETLVNEINFTALSKEVWQRMCLLFRRKTKKKCSNDCKNCWHSTKSQMLFPLCIVVINKYSLELCWYACLFVWLCARAVAGSSQERHLFHCY